MSDYEAEVTVTVIVKTKHGKVKATDKHVTLTEDDVQISASGLAYGLVEAAYGLIPDEADPQETQHDE